MSVQVYTLYEGSYSVDATKKFIPFDPERDNPKDRPGSLFIYVQPFLVELSNKLVLFDTGLGYSDDQGRLILHENIKKAGFQPEDVDLVLMSHLHYDHSGGMVHNVNGEMSLSFPEATYVIQRGEWETAFTKATSSYRTEIFEYLQRNAQITFIEDSGQLDEAITYELTGAHTPYHQAFLISEGNQKVFFGGDVLPDPDELRRKFIAKYDYDGRKAMELRTEFGNKAVEEHWMCLFYHGKKTATGYVEISDGNFKIIPQ